ncbi:MAG: hypothetical protein K8R49_00245 [Candidatus Cloacimonetes bacterium]|nr:hypothetical protein [Candidatus Cloacimonadota bacterium]
MDIPFSNSEIKTDDNHLSQFRKVSPPDSSECDFATDVWLWHDGKNLYLLWEVEIDESFVRGKYTSYDKSNEADFLRLQLITDVKSYYAYGYYAFPLNNKSDFIRGSSLSTNSSWNSTYDYASEITDNNWKVLMTIPFKDLRFSGSPPFQWKIVLSRHFYKKNETYNLPYLTTKMNKDYFRKAQDIVLKGNIRKNKNFYIRPYSIFIMDMEEKEVEFDEDNVGLDFSFNLSSSSRMKLSINPDFSDVPMDTEQDIYNLKYGPTYSENRYFFIEDINTLGVGNSTFYSRYIMQPQYAFKFTGKTENYSFGVLSTMDKQITEIVIIDTSTVTRVTNSDDIYNIFAFKPVGKQFSFQFTLLNKMNDDYHNEVLHLNPVWEITKYTSLRSSLNLSVKEIDDDSKNGYHGSIGYSFIQRDFSLSISAQKMSKDYALDMGRIYQDNPDRFYGWNINSYLSKDINSKHFRDINSKILLSEELDNATSRLLERYLSTNMGVTSQDKLSMSVCVVYVKELYHERYYEKNRFGFQIDWNKINWMKFSIGLNKIKSLIYELDEASNGYHFQFGLSGIIQKYFRYSGFAENIKYPDTPSVNNFDNNYWIGNLDLDINLSNCLSLTNGFRYNNHEYYDRSEHFGFFSNFRWKFRKECNLYIGYKSSFDDIENKLETDYEQVYIKVSYTF